jgi:YegS/Rv2252/BmrU family lipid kinase
VNLFLIANPVSGGNARARIDRASAWFRANGTSVEVRLTKARGDARRFATQALGSGCDRVVVAGGDGTLNEVANGLCGSALPVALLPMGTVNVFALETGIPFDLEPACRLAVAGVAQRISLGTINGEGFLLMTSAGWDADAVARLRPAVKRRLGRLAYGVAALEALWAKAPAPIEVVFPDGSRHTGFGVVASNARSYGGRYVITPDASLMTAQLEVCLFKRGGRFAMLDYALRLGLRLPLRPPTVEFYRVEQLAITGTGVPVQVDGDAWGTLPIKLACHPNALAVVLPSSLPKLQGVASADTTPFDSRL